MYAIKHLFFSEWNSGGVSISGAFSLKSSVLRALCAFVITHICHQWRPFQKNVYGSLSPRETWRCLPAAPPSPRRHRIAGHAEVLISVYRTPAPFPRSTMPFLVPTEQIHTQPSIHGTMTTFLSEANFLSTLWKQFNVFYHRLQSPQMSLAASPTTFPRNSISPTQGPFSFQSLSLLLSFLKMYFTPLLPWFTPLLHASHLKHLLSGGLSWLPC